MSLDAGRLRHRIILQKQQETQDPQSGAIVVTWIDVATVWAAIEPVSAREFVSAQNEISKITTKIIVRYRDDVTAKMRAYHAFKRMYYNIEGVLSDKESGLEYLTLPCSEGVRYVEGDPSAVVCVNLEKPRIVGGAAPIGEEIIASNGLWANDPISYTYQWYVNDIAITGATSKQWVVNANVDDIVTVRVVAVNEAGNSPGEFSAGVLVTND